MGSRDAGSAGGEGISADVLADSYNEVRRVARSLIGRGDSRIQATELANEAAIRLMGLSRMEIRDGVHLLSMAARTMRRILIDEARKAAAAKRQAPSFVTAWPDQARPGLVDLDDLDRALESLRAVSVDHAELVELRFMLGLTVEEAAAACNLSERTIKRRWQSARAWLLDYLGGDEAAEIA